MQLKQFTNNVNIRSGKVEANIGTNKPKMFRKITSKEYYVQKLGWGGEGMAAAREVGRGVSLMLNGRGELPCHSHK